MIVLENDLSKFTYQKILKILKLTANAYELLQTTIYIAQKQEEKEFEEYFFLNCFLIFLSFA